MKLSIYAIWAIRSQCFGGLVFPNRVWYSYRTTSTGTGVAIEELVSPLEDAGAPGAVCYETVKRGTHPTL